MNYLAQTTRPDIMYAVHQIAKFSADPREPHGDAILYLTPRYLKKTCDIGVHFNPNPEKGFECYCDADFLGNWTSSIADVDPSTSCILCWMSHHLGFQTSNADCLVHH